MSSYECVIHISIILASVADMKTIINTSYFELVRVADIILIFYDKHD